jgi:hypothetical protein
MISAEKRKIWDMSQGQMDQQFAEWGVDPAVMGMAPEYTLPWRYRIRPSQWSVGRPNLFVLPAGTHPPGGRRNVYY